jgi:hypothetical protein
LQNPWVALDVATDPLAHARALRRAHERAVGTDADTVADVRELVVASWRRSLAAGVTPDAPGGAPVLSDGELDARRDASPLAPVIDTIFDTLASLDGDARHVVAVADAQSNLLWVRGDGRTVEQAREMHFEEGASWSEAAAGTNAVGTAAALDHPVQIFSAEHLVAAVHPWTCSAAPIHDPLTGELIGVVDLTADLRSAHPHTLSLAALAAQAAEARLRSGPSGGARAAARPARLTLRLLGRQTSARLGDGPVERGLRSLELLAMLAMRPDGLTAEQLALALYGESGKTVTIRAQIHRVRARLGDAIVGTQPYRLGADIDTDLFGVQQLVAAGRPADALRAYRGPLLPGSDAPAIVEARMLLEETLRRSVLTTADPLLLSEWLAHEGGRDDLAAARALVAVLPGGDPRRAAATATAAAIGRRLQVGSRAV